MNLWFKCWSSGNNLHVNNWDSKGIKTIEDLLDNNGNFSTFNIRLKEIYGVWGTF